MSCRSPLRKITIARFTFVIIAVCFIKFAFSQCINHQDLYNFTVYDLQISGNKVVFQSQPFYDIQVTDIFLYDGNSFYPISIVSGEDYDYIYNANPQIDGNKVVWSRVVGTTDSSGITHSSGTTHIYLYDGTQGTKISDLDGNNSTFNSDPQISGNKVVWNGYDGNTGHIYQYDGTQVTKISTLDGNNSTNNGSPRISGNNVVWKGQDGTTHHIYLYDGTQVTKIYTLDGNNFIYNINLQISGNKVVWREHDGTTEHIYQYDGTQVTKIYTLDGNNSITYSNPQISGNKVVWRGHDGTTHHIYQYDGTQVTKISTLDGNNSTNNSDPQISGNKVVWIGYDGNTGHIYQYDGTQVTKISTLDGNNSTNNRSPRISGNNVAWMGSLRVFGIFLYEGNNCSGPFIYGTDTTIITGDTVNLADIITTNSQSTFFGITNGSYPNAIGTVAPTITTTYYLAVIENGVVEDKGQLTVFVKEGEITGRDTVICPGSSVDLSTLISGKSVNPLEFGTEFGNYNLPSSSIIIENTTTFYVRDSSSDSGFVDTTQITVFAEDTSPPALTLQDASIFLNNGTATLNINEVIQSVSDNCASNENITLSLSQTDFTEADLGSNQVTVTATDPYGNSTSVQTTVNVLTNILYVDIDATGENSGASWEDAITDLEWATILATGNSEVTELWVAEGTYTLTNPNEGNAIIVSNFEMYGGFEGNEFLREIRDPKNNITTIQVNDDFISPQFQSIITISDAKLDGFTVTGLRSESQSFLFYNAVIAHSNVILENVIFKENYGVNGGALRLVGSNNNVINCHFENNGADSYGSAYGGAVFLSDGAECTIKDSKFINNFAPFNGSGGAIYLGRNTSCNIINSFFIDNYASQLGGAVFGNGPGIQLNLTNSLFYQNRTVGSGPAIYFNGDVFEANNLTLSENFIDNPNNQSSDQFFIFASSFSLSNSIIAEKVLNEGEYGIFAFSYLNVTDVNNLDMDKINTYGEVFEDFTNPQGPDGIWGTADDGLQLHANSGLHDIGVTGLPNETALDIKGDPRVFNGAIDIGAYEAQEDLGCDIAILSCPAETTLYVSNFTCQAPSAGLTPPATNNCLLEVISNDAPTNLPVGQTTVTWLVTGPNADTFSCSQLVTVLDTFRPTISINPYTIQVGETLLPEYIVSNVTDNCSNLAEITISLSQTTFGCEDIGNQTIEITAIDEAGNVSIAFTEVTIISNGTPSIDIQNITVALGPDGTATISPHDIASQSGGCPATISLSQTTFNCANVGAGSANTALLFNGVNQHIQIPDHPSNRINGPYTMEAWVKFDPSSPALMRPISKPSAFDGTGNCIAMRNTGDLSMTFIDSRYNAPHGIGLPGAVSPDVWTHVAVSYDGTNGNIFLNGELILSEPIPPLFPFSNQPLLIGVEGLGSNFLTFRRFKGGIGQVRLWDRARTEAEITADYDQEIGPQPGLVGLYNLDDVTGNVAPDLSGQGVNGTLVNMSFDAHSIDGPLTQSGVPVMVTIQEANGNAYTQTAYVTVEDSSPPVITLNGDANITQETGIAFVDPGASAQDNCDGPLTVAIGGDMVDTNTPGIYNITYTAADNAGNETTITRAVNVIQETTPPVLTAVSIYNYDTFDVVGLQEPFTIDFTASEPLDIFSVSILINGQPLPQLSSFYEENNYRYIAHYATNDLGLETGPINFTINYADLNNNAGATVAASTDGSALTYDPCKTLEVDVPSGIIKWITWTEVPYGYYQASYRYADGGNPKRLTFSNPLGDSFEANGPTFIEPLSFFITVHKTCDGNTEFYPFDNTVLSFDQFTPEISLITEGLDEPYYITIETLSDDPYSPGPVYDFLASVNITEGPVDTIPPVLSPITLSSNNAITPAGAKEGDLISLDFTPNEPIQNVSVSIASRTAIVEYNGEWTAYIIVENNDIEGPVTFEITAEDLFGNAAVFSSMTDNSEVIIDLTPPLIDNSQPIDLILPTGLNPNVSFDFNPLVTDNNAPVQVIASQNLFDCSDIGTKSILVTATDFVGNSSNANFLVTVIDTFAPVPDLVSLEVISAECVVDSLIVPTAIDNCGDTITGVSDTPFPIFDQGTTIVTWTFTDVNGNSSTQTQNVVIDDVTPPAPDLFELLVVSDECLVSSIPAPTATDNCGEIVTGETTTTFPITTQGTTIVTWTYTDVNGNVSSQTQTVVIADTTAPVPVATVLPVIGGECVVDSLDAPTATDNCGEMVTGVTNSTFPITNQGTTIVTWSFTDVNGNVSSQDQTVVITDTTAPTPDVAVLPVIGEECVVDSLDAPTATDNCEEIVTGITSTSFPISDKGTTIVTWTFTDVNGNVSSQTQTIVIADTTAPVPDVAMLPVIGDECVVDSLDAPTATDNCGENITGVTSTLFPITDQGTTVVTWTFTDVNGNISSQDQTVVITDTTAPTPDVAVLPVIGEECVVDSLDAPFATDNCGESITGVTSSTFPITDQGTTIVTWNYTDVNGNVSSQTQTVVIADTSAPVPDATTLAVIGEECVVDSLPAPTATDNCGETVTGETTTAFPITTQGTTIVTWTYTDVNGNVSSQNQTVVIADSTAPVPDATTLAVIGEECVVDSLPAPTATDNCGKMVTGVTSTTFPITAQGTTIVTWTFTDVNGNSSSQNQMVVIADTTAPVPDVAMLAVIGDQCVVGSITAPTATDNCGENITGITSTSFPITVQGTTIVTWTFTDVNGNVASQNQTVEIADTTAPTPDVASLEVVSDECEVTGITPPTATDNCGEVVTGVTSTTFPINAQGTTVVTWTFTDVNGNVASQNQTVEIADTTAPTPDVASLEVVSDECEVTGITPPTATDNCGEVVTGVTSTTFPINAQGTTVVTWTFTDVNGNVSRQTQTVVIADTTAPVPDAVSLPVVSDECEVGSITAPTATDNCGESITGVSSTAFPITAQGTTIVTWTFTDVNGNVSRQTQTVVIADTTAPVPDAVSLPVVSDECVVGSITAPTATDNCGESITGVSSTAFPITAQGTTIVTWTFTDVNGNSSSQNQTVVIADTTAAQPLVTNLPDIIDGCIVETVEAPRAFDNCGDTIIGTTNTLFPITTPGTTVVNWSYSDAQGNQSTQTQNVIIDPTISYGIVTTRVWSDLNGDGIQNSTEETANVEGIMVHLIDDKSESILQSLMTNSSGLITFRDVPAGINLRLKYDLPFSYSFTESSGKLTVDDNSDVNNKGGDFGNTDKFKFQVACDTIDYIDAGILSPASIEARVWIDLNEDHVQNLDEETAIISGVVVELLDADDKDALLASVVSDNNGLASFPAVPVGRKLKLRFNPPSGFSFTKQTGKIEDIENSDAEDKGKSAGETSSFELETSGELVTYIDAGFLTPGSIEARVWNDLNGDNKQNASEDNANISGVTVQLLDADDKNALLATVVSDNNGLAVFPAVPIARKLCLKFIQPAGYEFTKKSGKIEDTDNSDAADKGKKAGETSTFELETSGELVTYVDVGFLEVLDLRDTGIRKIGVRNNNSIGIDQVTIAVYPNPASRLINITSDKEEIKNAMIFDSQGKLVLHSKDVNQFLNQLDISELKNGQYYILLKTESGRFIQQFIKM